MFIIAYKFSLALLPPIPLIVSPGLWLSLFTLSLRLLKTAVRTGVFRENHDVPRNSWSWKGVPLLHKFERSGSEWRLIKFRQLRTEFQRLHSNLLSSYVRSRQVRCFSLRSAARWASWVCGMVSLPRPPEMLKSLTGLWRTTLEVLTSNRTCFGLLMRLRSRFLPIFSFSKILRWRMLSVRPSALPAVALLDGTLFLCPRLSIHLKSLRPSLQIYLTPSSQPVNIQSVGGKQSSNLFLSVLSLLPSFSL